MAVNARLVVRDGIVVVVGSRSDEFTRKLAKINRAEPGRKSLAALYLEQINEGQR